MQTGTRYRESKLYEKVAGRCSNGMHPLKVRSKQLTENTSGCPLASSKQAEYQEATGTRPPKSASIWT